MTQPPAALSAAKQTLLAQRLRRRAGDTPTPGIPPLPTGVRPPLSYAQERLWFMEQYAPGSGAYTIPLVRRLRGAVDVPALARALDHVAARHQTLRMRYPAGADDQPTVVVDDEGSVPLTVADAGDEAAARRLVGEHLADPFDLAAGRPARALLVRLAPDDHVLALAVHHIAADGWSVEILLREVVALLAGDTLADLPVQYGDYAAWQRGRSPAASERELGFWRERLAGLTPLDLPTDRPRPPEMTSAGAGHPFRIGLTVTSALARLGNDHGATPYMTLLAAFTALLGRYAGQDDVTIGSPVAGRSEPEVEGLIGCFVNLLAMRVDLSGDPSFVELLLRVRDGALDAYAHQEQPFEQLVSELNVPRDASRSPVFQTVLAMQNYGGAHSGGGDGQAATGGLSVEGFGLGRMATRFDLELYVHEDGGELAGLFVYNTALFTPERVRRLGGHLTMLLAAVADDPHAPVAGIDVLTPEERAEQARWNRTGADLGDPDCLHRPVEAQARRTPAATAVVHPGGRLSYEEVEGRARAVAAELTAAGVRRGDLVAVVMERGWEQVVAVLAIHKAGAAYLPVDADIPRQRRDDLIERGGCTVALTQPGMAGSGDWPAGLTLLAVGGGPPRDAPGLPCPAEPHDLAYVIFTSGSTGTPKGVMIEHQAALNTVRDINRRWQVGPADRVLSLSALSFDLSVYDVFGALAAGAAVVMPAPAEEKDPAAWARLVGQERITVWDSVPALMELLVDEAEHGGADLRSLRLVLLSGDWIPLTLPDRIRALAPDAEVVSLGGATEGSIWSIYHPIGRVDPSWSSIPYGRPLANQSFHVLDRHRCAVPVGVPGELHIGGAGVASGYWRDPERTRTAFGTDPRTGERLYRTGDLGRYQPDGTIEFLGRADSQVKIRGYRVELGEIETQLARHPEVDDCVVTTRGQRGDRELVAYVVGAEGRELEYVGLRAHLARILPTYMIPTWFVTLPRLPLTANGKVDRNALPEPETRPAAQDPGDPGRTVTAPRTATERLIADVWKDVLGVDAVGIDDDFFDRGGHSLLAIRVVAKLRRAAGGAGPGIALTDLFRQPTVRELAALIDAPGGGRTARTLLHELTRDRGSRTAGPDLSFVCVPYGGGSAVVYQPLADALPEGYALWSVEIPGHDVGMDEHRLPFDALAAGCVAEILERVNGPIALYGHCGVGSALAVEIARQLEAAGRDLQAVYIGAIFPFARPRGRVMGPLSRLARMDRLRNDQGYRNWLTSMGVDLGDVDPDQARHIIRNMRRDTDAAEDYFTRLFEEGAGGLRAPVIAVAGERDPATEYYQERYREWHFLTGTAALVVLDEAGHFFLRHRAEELAEIVTGTHRAVASGDVAPLTSHDDHPGWWLHGVSNSADRVVASGPEPTLGRFAAVSAGQLVSVMGSALTGFAIPIWIYTTTGSVARFALFAVVGLVPGMLVAPLAGAIVDRADRRKVMLAGDFGAVTTQLVMGALLWTDRLEVWHIYVLLISLSVATTFQRLAHWTAIPQLVPKRYLGHANGIVQISQGTARLMVPLIAVGLLAAIGLEGILVLDVVSYTVAITVLLMVRFPKTMAWRRRESVMQEIVAGVRYSWGHRGFRSMLLFFAGLNVFLSPLFLMVTPLVLSFGTLEEVGRVSFLSGVALVVSGLALTVWGGPRHRRLFGVLVCTLALSVFCLVTGIRANLAVVAVGAFGMSLWLTMLNGIYATIVQVKVPQRFHGRVFALNTVIAWSTLPIGFGLVAPFTSGLLEPLMVEGGALAGSAGALIGTGEGRGIGLMYVLFAVAIAVWTVGALRTRALSHFDDEVPDAMPDDLIGVQALQARRQSVSSVKETA